MLFLIKVSHPTVAIYRGTLSLSKVVILYSLRMCPEASLMRMHAVLPLLLLSEKSTSEIILF